jgi:hypothetical protein
MLHSSRASVRLVGPLAVQVTGLHSRDDGRVDPVGKGFQLSRSAEGSPSKEHASEGGEGVVAT